MAVAKAITANDVINGGAAVCDGEKTTLFDPTQRTRHYAATSAVPGVTNSNTRFLYHGGTGGSGNWEH